MGVEWVIYKALENVNICGILTRKMFLKCRIYNFSTEIFILKRESPEMKKITLSDIRRNEFNIRKEINSHLKIVSLSSWNKRKKGIRENQ